jgi:hypothetical protein
MPPPRRVLIVSPHFPPINAPDMQRVRMSLPFYRANGWEPIVLCVADDEVDGVREPELLETLPPDVRVVRVRGLRLRWWRRIGIRNVGLRCWWKFLLSGAEIIRRERIDLVFFSNTQFVTFTLGRIWREWLGTPYVFDMQDPWRTDYYERAGSRRPPGGWKYLVARGMAWILEGWSFRHVSAVMSVSPSYLSDLRERYRTFGSVPTAVIGFGASRADFAEATKLPNHAAHYDRRQGQVHLLYTGASGPVMPHSLTVLFDALRLYRERNPAGAARLRFHFFGTSYVAPGQGKNSVVPVAQKCGVADQVDEIPHRLGHLECIRMQHDADALLLPGSSDLAYSPSKIYPYFLSGRPILAIVFQQSVLAQLLETLACAHVASFTELGPKHDAHEHIWRFFDMALAGFPVRALPPRNRAYFDAHFLADSLTREQCQLFDQAVLSSTSSG